MNRKARSTYDITYQGVTVTAYDGAIPKSLQPVVAILVRLLTQRVPKSS